MNDATTTVATAVMGLSEETLDKLRELRRLNIDSAMGFEECAELVESHGVKQAFVEIAESRKANAEQLGAQIAWNDEAEEEDGSYLAAWHRAWIKVREACSSDDVYAVVDEAKRGEESLCEAYQEAEQECRDAAIHALIVEQHASVKHVCNRLQGLIDAKDSDSQCT